MNFKNLVKIALDIIRYLSIFVKSLPLQDFDIIRYSYRLLTGFVASRLQSVDYLPISRFRIEK